MSKNDKYIKIGATVVFGVIVWCFWALGFPHALGFQEQMQCFLFDGEYFAERMTMPGGFARYVGEFFVQMYNLVTLGSAIIAISFILLQQATWCLARKNGSRSLLAYVMTFIPVLLLWWCMGDVKMRFTFVIALLLAEVAMNVYEEVKKSGSQEVKESRNQEVKESRNQEVKESGSQEVRESGSQGVKESRSQEIRKSRSQEVKKLVYLLVMTPLLAWLSGPAVLFFALYVAVRDNLHKPFDFVSLAMLVYAPACILVSARFCTLPIPQLFYGYHYSLNVMELSYIQYATMVVFALLPLLLRYMPEPKTQKNMKLSVCGTSVAMVIIAGVFLHQRFVTPEYDVIKYDILVRGQKWDKIITVSEKKIPDQPLTVASLNLALAMKGQLNERASQFYQNGWQGAFPPFNMDFEVSNMTSEIYFYLGLVNTAQRLNFEAMEALPYNTRSVRLVKHLAETNLINGQYAVARKYLAMLQKTMFYSQWATRTMALLGNEKAIDDHPVYGQLRKLRLKNDFLFSEDEIDKMMGQLLMTNKYNTIAMQYLLFLPQLENNPQKYQMYSRFLRNLYDKK